MTRTSLISLLLMAGHASAGEQLISVQHDSARGVTCWILNNTGISCLPDNSLPQTAAPARETGRASPVSSVADDEPLADDLMLRSIPCNTTEQSACENSQVSAPAPSSQDKRVQL